MGLALLKPREPLRLHIRCENCLRETSRLLDIPPEAEAPDDICDIAGEGYINNVKFSCVHCGSLIGRLFAISGGRQHE